MNLRPLAVNLNATVMNNDHFPELGQELTNCYLNAASNTNSKANVPVALVFSTNIMTKELHQCPFAPPKTKSEISTAKGMAVPQKMVANTNYCVGLWNQWCSHRATTYGDSISSLETIYPKDLAHHMSNFVFKIHKRDGSEFPPDTVHHIVSGLQRFVRWKNNPALDIVKDAEFRCCLYSEIKRLQRAGLGSRRRKRSFCGIRVCLEIAVHRIWSI